MEKQRVMLHIMTDLQSSRSNIAANFQNAITVQLLPPIGVFWDIENIQVPKGKSASSLVSAIRKRFFKRHREAEFMCVCDINKENKSIIHELNDAQVTVVHIDATSKNAADEKLRQCMRRFVNTHGSPSTIMLISDDVNFATDLSDFRHRHHVKIVLLHRRNAPEPLLACANEHYNFTDITQDLPYRSPIKSLNNRPRDVIVTGLPSNTSVSTLKKCLGRLSDNCGGKVKCVSKTEAIVSFANADAAERAQKRMDKEMVFGHRISVDFLNRHDSDWNDYASRRSLFKETDPTYSSSSGSSRDSSPLSQAFENKEIENPRDKKVFVFPPLPILDGPNLPSVLKSPTVKRSPPFISTLNPAVSQPFIPISSQSASGIGQKLELINSQSILSRDTSVISSNSSKNFAKPLFHFPAEEMSFQSPAHQKNVGRVLPFLMQDSSSQPAWSARNQHELSSLPHKSTNSHADHFSQRTTNFQSLANYSMLSQCSNIREKTSEPSTNIPSHVSTANQLENTSFTDRANVMGGEYPTPVELYVTNLDQSFEVNEMKKILLSVFSEHIMVLHISMVFQPDGNTKAIVKVPSLQHAQVAISHLQKRKIGHKRILISHVANDRIPPFCVLKSEVVALLKDIPTKKLPVFKFRELYEKRYHRAISVSELYKMRDAISIQEEASGRTVCLNPDYQGTPTSSESDSSQELPPLEKPYCEKHFHLPETQGWAEQESISPLPDVVISLKNLATAVHRLLDSHLGALPLMSFCSCYEADIGPLPVDTSLEEENNCPFSSISVGMGVNKTPRGVPLEHLITCIAGVEIAKSNFCVKKVQWCGNKEINSQVRSISPILAGPLCTFGREAVDLLKNQPRSMVLFNKFIPVYHHHFGRQCRVSDYGFTKLIDLLEAVPHIIQVIGEGQNRIVTLTHRSQVKRFATDLLRMLKSKPSKQITLSELPLAFEQCMEKVFNITNYGVCYPEDLLTEVPENTIVVDFGEDEKVISLPRREQTTEEIERTNLFALDVIELLKHTPACSMTFNKFIPAYHHHFGKQCRVADYGFTKLIELFEAISAIEVQGTGEDKVISLIEKERDRIVAERLTGVIKAQPNEMIALSALNSAYVELYGHILRPADYGAADMAELLRKLQTSLRVVEGYAGSVVTIVDKGFIRQLSLRIRRILMEQAKGKMPVEELNRIYQKRFGHSVDLAAFNEELDNVIKVESGIVELLPLQLLARDMLFLLQDNQMQLPLQSFIDTFIERFGVPLRPVQYGFSSLAALVSSMPEYFSIKGRKQKRTIHLNRNICESPLPYFQEEQTENDDSSTISHRRRLSHGTSATSSTSGGGTGTRTSEQRTAYGTAIATSAQSHEPPKFFKLFPNCPPLPDVSFCPPQTQNLSKYYPSYSSLLHTSSLTYFPMSYNSNSGNTNSITQLMSSTSMPFSMSELSSQSIPSNEALFASQDEPSEVTSTSSSACSLDAEKESSFNKKSVSFSNSPKSAASPGKSSVVSSDATESQYSPRRSRIAANFSFPIDKD